MTSSACSKKVILFIDDEKICHILAELIIPNFTEYKLVGAYNGKDALTLAKRHKTKIGLILSDIMLPDMTGYDIQKKLKQDDKLCNIPFIFQSGIAKEETDLKKNIKDTKIIHKPYNQEELIEIISAYAK